MTRRWRRADPGGRIAVALLATSLGATGAWAAQIGGAEGETDPPVGEIVRRAVERARAQDEAQAELAFESTVLSTVQSISGDGEIDDTTVTRYKRYPLEGLLYEELIEKDGRALTEREAREEREKRDRFVRDVRRRAAQGEAYKTNDERTVRFDEELMARYQASLVGTERIGAEDYWVVSFEPREGSLPERSRMDKAMNRSTGRLYISRTDYGVARVEFQMQEPVKYMWGLLATLQRAEGRLSFARVDDGLWLPRAFDVQVHLRVLFSTVRRHITRDWVERTRLDTPVVADDRLEPLTSRSGR